jgi:hypothetical protein
MTLDIAVSAMVTRAVNPPDGSPDWLAILNIVSVLEQGSLSVPVLLRGIAREFARLNRGGQMNCLVLIDALFKNSKPVVLKALAGPQLADFLSDPMIDDAAPLHNLLHQCMPAWLSALRSNQIANQRFIDFCEQFAATHYVPEITPPIRAKLLRDLSSANDVLALMTECVVSASRGDANEQLLLEILGNVREISERLIELTPMVEDPQLKTLISNTRDFCAMCIQSEAAFRGGRPIDEAALATVMTRSKAALDPAVEQAQPPPRQRRVAPRRAVLLTPNDIPDDLFWGELTALKAGPAIDPLA